MLVHALRRSWCYLVGLAILSTVIGVHEAGHWVASELCGARCKSFNLGFGPGVQVGTINGTELWLRSIPLGGSVELPMTGSSVDSNSISDLSTAEKLFVFVAGVAVNALCAATLMWYLARSTSTVSPEQRWQELVVQAAIQAARKEAVLTFEGRFFFGERVKRVVNGTIRYCTGAVMLLASVSEGALTGKRGILRELAILSAAFAVTNLLPIPPLDGARMVDAVVFSGVLSGGRPVETITSTELVAIGAGVAFFAIPVILGVIPGIIALCRYEAALYRRLSELQPMVGIMRAIEVVEEGVHA